MMCSHSYAGHDAQPAATRSPVSAAPVLLEDAQMVTLLQHDEGHGRAVALWQLAEGFAEVLCVCVCRIRTQPSTWDEWSSSEEPSGWLYLSHTHTCLMKRAHTHTASTRQPQ